MSSPWQRLTRWILRRREGFRPMEYWEQRARVYGARAVLNIGHTEEELAEVTERQRAMLLPLLRDQLNGGERTVLDFGCGPGRFTPQLAELVGGRAIGVDPIRSLLELAPQRDDVEYRQVVDGRIPLETSSVDVAWICLVLGVITAPADLAATIEEVRRVLRPGGVLFVVENTAKRRNKRHFHFRSEREYARLLRFATPRVIARYEDLGQRISVFAGYRDDAGA